MSFFNKLFASKQPESKDTYQIVLPAGEEKGKGPLTIHVKNDLFLIPVCYDGDDEVLSAPDHELHFSAREAQMAVAGASLFALGMPEEFAPATTSRGRMHYQTIMGPDGKRFMPLFISYDSMVNIFGKNIRIGVICFDTAMEFCRTDNYAGVVVAPGDVNRIIPKT